jgi:hypothetical protein
MQNGCLFNKQIHCFAHLFWIVLRFMWNHNYELFAFLNDIIMICLIRESESTCKLSKVIKIQDKGWSNGCIVIKLTFL